MFVCVRELVRVGPPALAVLAEAAVCVGACVRVCMCACWEGRGRYALQLLPYLLRQLRAFRITPSHSAPSFDATCETGELHV